MRSFTTLSEFRYLRLRRLQLAVSPGKGTGTCALSIWSIPTRSTPESVLDNLAVSLDVEDLSSHVMVWDKYVRLNNLPVEYDSTYDITMKSGLKDIYGRELGMSETVTIEVGPASSYYYIPHGGYRFLESQFDPRVVFEYQNLKSGKWGIETADNPYLALPESRLTRDFDLSGQVRNRREFEMIDLKPWLNDDGKGAVAMSWMLEEEDNRWGPYKQDLVLQVTDLGVTVRYGYNKVLVWVNSLTDGAPAAGAEVSLLSGTRRVLSAETDGEGLAVFDLDKGGVRQVLLRQRREKPFPHGSPVRFGPGRIRPQQQPQPLPVRSLEPVPDQIRGESPALSPFSSATGAFTSRARR